MHGSKPGEPRWGLVWAMAFGLATFAGWSTVALMHFGMIAIGRPLPLRVALMANLPDWYFWAALSPPVFWLAGGCRSSVGTGGGPGRFISPWDRAWRSPTWRW